MRRSFFLYELTELERREELYVPEEEHKPNEVREVRLTGAYMMWGHLFIEVDEQRAAGRP